MDIFKEHISEYSLIREAIGEYKLTIQEIQQVKKGNDIVCGNGVTVANDKLAYPIPTRRKFSYCTDTIYDPEIVPFIKDSDLLYHEAVYLDELREKAHERMHAITVEASEMALKAKVKALIVGHYSSRYKDLTPILHETQSIFANSYLVIGGKTYPVG